MSSQRPAEERRQRLLRGRRLIRLTFVALGAAAVCGVFVAVIDPSKWWLPAVLLVLGGYMVIRNVQRLRVVSRALAEVEDQLHGDGTIR